MPYLITIAQGLLCLAAILLLDWATFVPTLAPLGITPWNPSIGVVIAVVLIGGLKFAPLLFLGPLCSDAVVRALPFPLWLIILEAALIGLGYYIGLRVLMRRPMRFDRELHHLRDLLLLGAVISVAAGLVSFAYNGMLVANGLLEANRLLESTVRYFLGEVIGIVVMTPFLLLMAFRRDFPTVTLEGGLQFVAILVVVALVVGFTRGPQLQLSFLLLLPILWLGVRHGFEGATAGLLLMQVCIMVALQLSGGALADVTMFQALMVMLAVAGLAIGLLISERTADERRLREQQDALARAARLGSMGEFATAIAHEINQPLTAAGNYARATVAALKGDTPRIADARIAAEGLIEQVDRSAQVIRRLRELIRAGRLTAAPESVDRLLRESLELVRPALQRRPVQIDLMMQPALPTVSIDLIQIEQVITNLLRNAIEALSEAKTEQPRIILGARRQSEAFVEISVADNGPGFPVGFDPTATRPLASGKADGLGVGLSLCQSIVEAHGGALTIDTRTGGATVRFTIPVVASSDVTEANRG